MDNGSKRPKSVMFKPVAGGWVYRARNPLTFGDAPHYLVNDAQKAQIEALIIPRWPALFAAILALGIFAWTFVVKGIVRVFFGHLVDAQKAQIEAMFIPRRPALLGALRLGGAAVWMLAVVSIVRVFSGHDEPSIANVVAIAVLFAISLVPVANWLQRRRLQPILPGLQLTQERITFAEMRENVPTQERITLADSDDTAQEEEAIAHLLKRELLRRGHLNGPIDDVWDPRTVL